MMRWLPALLAAFLSLRAAHAGVGVGEPFPSLSVRSWDGTAAVLDVPSEGTVLIDLWASWCAPCREALPALANLAAGSPQGPQVILLNIDTDRAKADVFLQQVLPERRGVQLLFDPAGRASATLGAPGMPTLYIVEDGIIRQVEVGFSAERLEKWRVRRPTPAQP